VHPRRAADRRGGDPRHRLPGRLACLWRLMARRSDALLGDLPRRRDLGVGRARPLALDERALAADLAIHHQRDLPDDAAQPHHGPELRAAHTATNAGAALAEYALRRIAPRHHASLDPRSGPSFHAAAPGRGHGQPAAARPKPAAGLAAGDGLDRRRDRALRRRLCRLPAPGSPRLARTGPYIVIASEAKQSSVSTDWIA